MIFVRFFFEQSNKVTQRNSYGSFIYYSFFRVAPSSDFVVFLTSSFRLVQSVYVALFISSPESIKKCSWKERNLISSTHVRSCNRICRSVQESRIGIHCSLGTSFSRASSRANIRIHVVLSPSRQDAVQIIRYTKDTLLIRHLKLWYCRSLLIKLRLKASKC